MEQLVNFIIRPPRAEYNPDCDLLDDDFMLKGKCYQRKDMEIKNNRGDVLQCSHYMPLVSPEGKPLPCVIYCHGNSGCRADASEAAIILLPSNITVFALDFSGSGLSGGEHVTLGWNEKDDLKAVVDYLRADGNVSLIGLWGRSMGAVTSLMYGAEDPSIAGMVLDSPFSDLVELMMELVDTYKFRLPKFTVKFAIQIMRKAIQKKAKFDITELNTIKVAKSCFVPVLFGHAVDDDFIHPRHSDCIFEAYVGDKNIIKFEGDHNSPRPQFYFDSINIFFHNVLQPPEDEMGATLNGSIHDYFGKGSWLIPDLGFISESSAASKGMTLVPELATTSSKVAIEQVLARRPISRTEVPSDIPSEENNLGCQDKDAIGHKGSSSSDMLSFEFSNGDPFGPLVPTTTDDDQFVEYELDDLTAFPCNVEEEEKMFMEAIIESLKDLEKPEACASSSESSHKDDTNSTDTTSSTMEKYSSLSPESIPTPGEHTSDTSVLTVEPVIETGPPIMVPRSTGASAQSDTAVSTQTSSDAVDISARTKATLTVERNPSNNIIDGLMRRWDLSFFRNSR